MNFFSDSGSFPFFVSGWYAFAFFIHKFQKTNQFSFHKIHFRGCVCLSWNLESTLINAALISSCVALGETPNLSYKLSVEFVVATKQFDWGD